MGTLVVDASVFVAGLVEPQRKGFLKHLLGSVEVVVPQHCDAEVGSALRGLVVRGSVDTATAIEALATYALMRISRHNTLGLLARAFSLHANVTFGDALYLALAEQLSAPIVSLDQRLIRAARQQTPHLEVRLP